MGSMFDNTALFFVTIVFLFKSRMTKPLQLEWLACYFKALFAIFLVLLLAFVDNFVTSASRQASGKACLSVLTFFILACV